MATFVVTYTYTSDRGRQASVRPRRYAFFQRIEQQRALLASGQLLDGDLGEGLLVLRAADAAAVATMLDEDPFVQEGLVDQRRIVGWNPTTGAWVNP